MQTPHASLWPTLPSPKTPPTATLPAAAEVVVVGAGISGLSAAVALSESHCEVAVIDMADRLGRGDTGQTTAHITQILDAGYSQVRDNFGLEAARAVAKFHGGAIDVIESLVRQFAIPCRFARVPAYLYAEPDQDARQVAQERAAMREVGLDPTQPSQVPLPYPTQDALKLANQAQFDPVAYLEGLRRALGARGVPVCLSTRMRKVTADKKAGRLRVDTSAGTIMAKHVIYATHTPPTKMVLQTKLNPQRSYALALRCAKLPPAGLYYDVAEPYHYLRTQPTEQGDVLIVGGNDHRFGDTTDTDQVYAQLETWARARFKVQDVVASWSGEVFEPVDGLPFVGNVPGHQAIFMIAGLSGHGMTSGTMGGIICAQQILGKSSRDVAMYAPSRFKPVAQATAFAAHNLQTTQHMVKDRLQALLSHDDVGPNEGGVVRHGVGAAAVYNDGTERHILSAVCPHAGCYVQWNKGEKTWDCPCHGSRFSCTGRLLSGPATSDLAKMKK